MSPAHPTTQPDTPAAAETATDTAATSAADPGRPAMTSVVSGAGWLGLGAGTVKAAQTVVLLILAILLEPSAIGVIAVGSLVLNVTTALTDLGSSTALVHWRGERREVERAARTALSVALGGSLLLTALVWVLAPGLSTLLQTGDAGTGVIRGLMLCLPFTAVAGVSKELLRRDLAFRRRVVPDIAGALVGAVVSVSLAAGGAGVASLVVGQLVQAVLVMVLCWRMRPVVRLGWSRTDLGDLLSYGGHLAGANIAMLLMLNVDYLIVAHQLGASAVGVYSMAFRLAYMPYLLVGMVIAGAAFAHLCRLTGPALGSAVVDTAVVLLRIVTPLYLGIWLLAPQLELLGHQWAPGVPALRWLAGYGLLLSALHVCEVALNAAGRTRDSLLLNGLHLVLLTVLLTLWVRQGVTYAAVAQVVAAAVVLLVAAVAMSYRIAGVAWADLVRRVVPSALGALVMAVVAIGAHVVWPGSRVSAIGLVVVGSASLAAYLVVLLALDRPASAAVAALAGGRRLPGVRLARKERG